VCRAYAAFQESRLRRGDGMDDLSDLVLLQDWRAGDGLAGNALLSRHFTPLRAFLRNKAGPDGDDLLQRTLLACTESCQRIRGESTFRTYLYTIARHELYRYFRQRSASNQHVDFDACVLTDPSSSVVEALVCAESRRALSEALQLLCERDRKLLSMFYVEGLDSPTLAARLGIKPTSVRARLRRARTELQAALVPHAGARRARDSVERTRGPLQECCGDN
jgi:RNA polymerase sigma factor (sigma-70 family)